MRYDMEVATTPAEEQSYITEAESAKVINPELIGALDILVDNVMTARAQKLPKVKRGVKRKNGIINRKYLGVEAVIELGNSEVRARYDELREFFNENIKKVLENFFNGAEDKDKAFKVICTVFKGSVLIKDQKVYDTGSSARFVVTKYGIVHIHAY